MKHCAFRHRKSVVGPLVWRNYLLPSLLIPDTAWSQITVGAHEPTFVTTASLILLPVSLVLLIAYLWQRHRVQVLQRLRVHQSQQYLAIPADKQADASDRKPSQDPRALKELMNAKALAIGNIGTWSYDIDAEELTWSDHLYVLLGLDPEMHPATTEFYLSMVHRDDRERITKWIGELRTNTSTPFENEYRIVRPDGAIRVLRDHGDVSRDANGRAYRVTGILIDSNRSASV